MLSFNNVSYHYGGGYGVSDVTYTIRNGEFVFLVGPSGAGKSTILKLVNLEVAPSKGHIILDSINTAHVHPREIPFLRRKAGYVFQDFKLLRDRNVYDNIAFAMHAVGARRRSIKKRVLEILKDVGLTHKRLKNPVELSGGEQQRVAIARALINSPYILLADEPTGNLDDETAEEILDLLVRINARGTAVLMATHKHELAERLGKRTIFIRNGRIET
jgi:cell division transport system ATP-binding protein